MSFTFAINRELLIKELTLVSRAVETKATIPILMNVMLENLPSGTIKLTCTDLEIGITSVLPANIAQPGAITLPAKPLLNALRKLPGDMVAFLCAENHWATIVAGSAKVQLAGMGRDSYPELPKPKTGAALIIDGAALNSLIDRTKYAISVEENRFTLNGALIVSNGTTRMIGTDGHRLAFAELPIKARSEFRALIPTKALRLIPLLYGKNGKALFSFDDDHGYITVADRQLIFRKLKGNFPDYERVMPTAEQRPTVITLPVEQTLTVVERAKLFADQRSRAIRLSLTTGRLQVQASAVESGSFSEFIACDYEGDPKETGFNADYLLEFLRTCQGAVELCVGKSTDSWLLRPAERSELDYRYVLMPMRV